MRNHGVKVVIVVIVMLGAAAALLPLLAESREPREIVLVAKQMAFYAGDSTVTNPTIHMAPGERIRITLVNDDPGVGHDFAVSPWSLQTPVLRGKGRTSIVIQAPEQRGTTEYVCSLHASMMTGTIQVGSGTEGASSER
jgi:plastocyanin